MAEQIHRYGLLRASHVSPELDEKYGPLIDAQIDEDLSPVLDGMEKQIAAIKSSNELTGAGKLAATKKVGRGAHEKIDALTAKRRMMLDRDSRNLNLPIIVPSSASLARQRGDDPNALQAAHRELRESLANMDPVQRGLAVREAAKTGDDDLVVAAIGNHPLLQAVDGESAAEAKRLFLEKHSPPEAAIVREAIGVYDANANMARQIVHNRTGVTSTQDPVFNPGEEGVMKARMQDRMVPLNQR